jgi:SAM-dependent methyltransferase
MPASEPRCPLCGTDRTAAIFTKQETDYRECRDCRFRFATPAVNPNLVTSLEGYEEAYLQYLGADASDAANFQSLYDWIARFAPIEGKRVLDVGAGSGKWVRFLRARGVDAHGLEPARALFDRFLAGDPAFTCATLAEFQGSAPAAFDLVTAFDVIEHVADPPGLLQDVATAMSPGGKFFASTPDVESLAARAFGRRWHFYYPYHLSYFGPRTLARAAAAHGLRMIDCRHRGRLRSVGYIVRYAAEFVGGVRAPRWARRLDGWYLPVNLFDTMYVVCERGA